MRGRAQEYTHKRRAPFGRPERFSYFSGEWKVV